VNCLSTKHSVPILMSYYETASDDYMAEDDIESETDYDFED